MGPNWGWALSMDTEQAKFFAYRKFTIYIFFVLPKKKANKNTYKRKESSSISFLICHFLKST